MAKEVLVNYLSDNIDKFNLEDLKKQIISRGYSEEDYGEALAEVHKTHNSDVFEGHAIEPAQPAVSSEPVSGSNDFVVNKDDIKPENNLGAVNLDGAIEQLDDLGTNTSLTVSGTPVGKIEPKPLGSSDVVVSPKESFESAKSESENNDVSPGLGRKKVLLRLASIIGFVMCGIFFLDVILEFAGFGLSGLLAGNGAGLTFPLILGIFIMAGVLIYFLGFARLGKYTRSKMMRVTSIILVVFIVGFIVLGVFAFIYLANTVSLTSGFAVADMDDFDFAGSSFDQEMGNPFSEPSVPQMPGLAVPIIILVIFLVFLVARILFSVSLIHVRNQLPFCKLAGIMGLLVIGFLLIEWAYMIYLILNPMVLMGIFMESLMGGGNSTLVMFYILNILIGICGLLSLLFESIVLMKGSKRFEA